MTFFSLLFLLFLSAAVHSPLSVAHAWEPTKPIEFVIPAGTGGGADQMARLVSGIADKHKLSPRPLIVVNKAGGAGAEGFLYVKEKGMIHDHHHLSIFLSLLHTGSPLTGRSDSKCSSQWINSFSNNSDPTPMRNTSHKKEKSAGKIMKMRLLAQEDQILTIQLEQRSV
jgi:hypothetical protein